MTDTATLAQTYDYAPAGYRTVTPYLAVQSGADALDYYARAFGATVLSRMDGADGKVMHAEILVGDSVLQLSDEFPDLGLVAPRDGVTGSFNLYVPDADAVHAAAVAAGGTAVTEVADSFSGDRMGTLRCPFGHRWVILTRTEHLSDEEIERRARQALAGG